MDKKSLKVNLYDVGVSHRVHSPMRVYKMATEALTVIVMDWSILKRTKQLNF